LKKDFHAATRNDFRKNVHPFNAAVSKNGTVGVPEQYAIRIAIVHGFITQGSNRGGYAGLDPRILS
jgi:hypothetical protein